MLQSSCQEAACQDCYCLCAEANEGERDGEDDLQDDQQGGRRSWVVEQMTGACSLPAASSDTLNSAARFLALHAFFELNATQVLTFDLSITDLFFALKEGSNVCRVFMS